MNQNENELLMLISAQMNTEDLHLLALKRLRDESSEAPKKRVRQGNKKNFRHLGEEALQRRDYFLKIPSKAMQPFAADFASVEIFMQKLKKTFCAMTTTLLNAETVLENSVTPLIKR